MNHTPLRIAKYGREHCGQCGNLYRVANGVCLDHVCEPIDVRYADLEPVVAALKIRFGQGAGDDELRHYIFRIFEACPSLLETALQQDDSFVHRRHGSNKAGRARKISIAGEVVSFSLERHPGTDVAVQRWDVNLSTLIALLVSDAGAS